MYPLMSFKMPPLLMVMVSGFTVEPECVTPTTRVPAVSVAPPPLLPVTVKLPFVPSPTSNVPAVAGVLISTETVPSRFGPAAPIFTVHVASLGGAQLYSLPLAWQTQFVLPPDPNQVPLPPFQYAMLDGPLVAGSWQNAETGKETINASIDMHQKAVLGLVLLWQRPNICFFIWPSSSTSILSTGPTSGGPSSVACNTGK